MSAFGQASEAATPPVDATPTRLPELRIAVAMNGGVSLAIWIGGVCNEFLRLVNRCPDDALSDAPSVDDHPYAIAAWCAGVRPRLDVLAGASAGGLNSIFLGLGIVHGHRDLSVLRDLWIDHGGFGQLLRDPLDDSSRSLMKGDEYFLPKLRDAVATLLPDEPSGYSRAVDVLLTATSLPGSLTTYALADDDEVVERPHGAVFRFRHGGDIAGEQPSDLDVGEGGSEFARERLVERLARACRSTASFPGAFEPSRVHIKRNIGPSHPNDTYLPRHLREIDVRTVGDTGVLLIDGGTLVNLPVGDAITAVFEQRSNSAVRRKFAMIVPDPGRTDTSPDSCVPKALAVVMAAGSTIPRQQRIGETLDQIRNHNDELAALWETRRGLLTNPLARIFDAATALLPPYDQRRNALVPRRFEADLERQFVNCGVPLKKGERRVWLTAARALASPWRVADVSFSAGNNPGSLGRWGITAVRRSAVRVLWLLREVERGSMDSEFANLRDQINGVLDLTGAISFSTQNPLFGQLVVPDPSLDGRIIDPDTAAQALTTALLVWQQIQDVDIDGAFGTLADVLKVLAGFDGSPRSIGDLSGPSDRILFLLALEVIETAYRGFGHFTEQQIDVVRIDGNGTSPIDLLGRADAHQKVAGVQLGHFGSFFRASWRANDWMWGRLDGGRDVVGMLLQNAPADRIALAAEQLGVPVNNLLTTLEQRLHTEIVDEERQSLVKAFEIDDAAGGINTPSSIRLIDRLARPTAPAEDVLTANLIGEERVSDHLGSDQLSMLASTALATAATSFRLNVPNFVRPPVTLFRYVTLVLWGLMHGAVGGRALRTVSAFAFGLGVAMVAIEAFTSADLGVLGPVGLALLVAGTLLGLMRAPMLAAPILVLGAVPLGLAYLPGAAPLWWADDIGWPSLHQYRSWLPAICFVASGLAIGSVRRPRWWGTWKR
ncbi:hypothetical protein BH24ACT5_BH24ACT5_00310 [soil metagenome]